MRFISYKIFHNLGIIIENIYLSRKNLSPILTQKLILQNREHPYNLRHLRQFKTPSVNKVFDLWLGKRFFLGPKTWEFLPHSLKRVKSAEALKINASLKVALVDFVGYLLKILVFYV